MKYVQAKLRRNDVVQTAWIEKKKGVKKGCYVELKETKEFWHVEELYSKIVKDAKELEAEQKMNKDFGPSIK